VLDERLKNRRSLPLSILGSYSAIGGVTAVP
jgi:hypothetical protein